MRSRVKAETKTGGRAATLGIIPGRYALSVGNPNTPLPEGWRWVRLSDVARLETGHTPSRRKPEYWGGDVPWVGIRDATANHGKTIYDTTQHTNKLGLDNSSARLLPANTVCLSRTASVGYVVVMGRPMATSQDFVNWVCSDHLNHDFLRYVLLVENDSMLRFASGTTHQTIYFPEAKAFHVAMPERREQDRIAHILGTLDDKIELNRRMNETLEAMARALFKSWFVDFDPVRVKAEAKANGKLGSPDEALAKLGIPPNLAPLFPDEFEDSALGMVPKGWGVGTLGDIADNARRSVQPEDCEPEEPYIGLEHMPRKCITLGDWGSAEVVTSNKSRFYEGEFLFGKLRPYFHKVGMALVDGVCSTDILVVSATAKEWSGYVLFVISSEEFVNYTDGASTGTKMPRTNWKDMAKYPIVLPPNPLADRFSQLVKESLQRIRANVFEAKSLTACRDALLPKLLSGEVRVGDVEAEAAEVV